MVFGTDFRPACCEGHQHFGTSEPLHPLLSPPSRGIITLRLAMIFHVTMDTDEAGWVVAECPALPGCVSQGRDEKEALANIKEAITGWMWAEDKKATAELPPDQLQILVSV